MVNLLDIMRQAQQGNVYDNMARQFGLSVAEAQRAAEALLPAFSLGLQRSGADPTMFANVLSMMTSGRYAPFYDKWSPTFWPQAQASGNDVVGLLFGSPETARRVAAQVSAMSGIGQQVIQQMMPYLAATMMGGLFKALSVEGFADFLRQWADWLQSANFRTPPRRMSGAADSNPFAPWIEMTRSMLAPPAPVPSRPAPASKSGDPWSDLVKAWSGAYAPAPPPPPPPPPPPKEPNPFEALSQMFDLGREVQTQHLATLQTLFDSVWAPGRGR